MGSGVPSRCSRASPSQVTAGDLIQSLTRGMEEAAGVCCLGMLLESSIVVGCSVRNGEKVARHGPCPTGVPGAWETHTYMHMHTYMHIHTHAHTHAHTHGNGLIDLTSMLLRVWSLARQGQHPQTLVGHAESQAPSQTW